MRIGFFTDGFLPQPNGVSTSVMESAQELERRGHEVYIIAPKYPGYKDKNPRIIRLTSFNIHKPTRTRFALPDKSLRKILSLDFDIIHGHSGGPLTLLGWELARAKKIPFVGTYHTLWNRYTHYFFKGKVVTPKMMERATKIFGNQIDFLIAPSKRVEQELRSYGVKRPIRVIPSGVDVEKFTNAKKGVLRSKLNLPDDVPIVLYVGRLGPEKSVDFIIRSFKKVIDKNSRAHLVIVGVGVEQKKLERLANRLRISENAHFLGEIQPEDIPAFYADATVFTFASKTETQGLAILEALAAGVPVVAVDDPALSCVENGKNGFLVQANEEEFSNKILLLTESKKLWEEFSGNALKSSENLSVGNMVDALEQVYFPLVEKNNKNSVSYILGTCSRNETAFAVAAVFWVSIVLVRFINLLIHNSFYPKINLFSQMFYGSTLGFVLLLVFVALFTRKRTMGFASVIMLGAGLALISNEIISVLFFNATYLGYWNIWNIIPIIFVGIIPIVLFHDKKNENPNFYISTREPKHANPQNPKVTVVVPAYNESNFIIPTLKSLINQTYKEFELIVVDNNSTDDTADVAASFGARVVLQKIKGVAAARQAGFFESRGQIIVSTDADAVVPENWLAQIVEKYEKNPELVGFGGLSLLYSGAVTARAAGRFIFPIFWQVDRILSGGFNMAGFNMSVRKSAFVKVGGFDPALKMGEDIDLSQKLRTVGKVDIDSKLIAYASGRRFAQGLMPGLMVYAPWWISKVILRRERPFEFPAVRSEKSKNKNFVVLPISFMLLALCAMFYIANSAL